MSWFRFLAPISLTAIFALALAACVPVPASIDTDPSLPALLPGWTKIEAGGETRCARDTPYAFWVRPGASNDLFIYFQGGGGCYNAETCGLTGSYKDDVTDKDNPAFAAGGVFNLDHEDNPFRDFTMLFVPYCTGDVHAGNRDTTYTANSGKSFDIYHRGQVNAAAALDWAYANVKQPDSIFVSGCSAGSIGSILHAPHIIRQYPNSLVTQLGDSAGGLTSYIPWNIDADYDAGQYFPSWIPGMQEEIAHSFTISKFYNAVAGHYPTYIFAQYNAEDDRTQKRYYTADGGSDGDFAAAMQTSLNEIHESSDNFRSYTGEGERHCIMAHTEFFYEEVDGVRFQDWVADLAERNDVRNVGCATCE